MKILKIEDCGNCPYYKMLPARKSEKGIVEEWCEYGDFSKKINNSFDIPSWCPLEDYNESNHK